MSETENMIKELKLEVERLKFDNRALLKLASHDLRSPLNKVFALVNLLKMSDDELSDEQQGYIENIEMVLSDGLQRMRNIMELRGLEEESVKTYHEAIDLARLIKRSVEDQVLSAKRKGIRFNVKAESLTIISDKLILLRILDQILWNALKFSPKNSEIDISLSEEPELCKISIADGGYGIAEEEQGQLFKKFSVLSTTTTGGESKTGLGLFLAQSNAQKLGGKISYSNDGQSVFVIDLPKNNLA